MAWHSVAKADDLDDDDVIGVEVDDTEIAVFKLGGVYYATHNICTHEYACLSDGYIEGDRIECPLHQGYFHIPTGKAEGAPVTEDIPTYPVKEEGGEILVDVPDK